jgi:hypothetical protein
VLRLALLALGESRDERVPDRGALEVISAL